MLKEYKYYFISVNIIDGRGRLFRVRVVINNKSAFVEKQKGSRHWKAVCVEGD